MRSGGSGWPPCSTKGADLVPIASDVRTNLDAFADRLADAGAQVDAVSMPVSLADGLRTWQQLVLPIFGHRHARR